jgi:hypothetical protein
VYVLRCLDHTVTESVGVFVHVFVRHSQVALWELKEAERWRSHVRTDQAAMLVAAKSSYSNCYRVSNEQESCLGLSGRGAIGRSERRRKNVVRQVVLSSFQFVARKRQLVEKCTWYGSRLCSCGF